MKDQERAFKIGSTLKWEKGNQGKVNTLGTLSNPPSKVMTEESCWKMHSEQVDRFKLTLMYQYNFKAEGILS